MVMRFPSSFASTRSIAPQLSIAHSVNTLSLRVPLVTAPKRRVPVVLAKVHGRTFHHLSHLSLRTWAMLMAIRTAANTHALTLGYLKIHLRDPGCYFNFDFEPSNGHGFYFSLRLVNDARQRLSSLGDAATSRVEQLVDLIKRSEPDGTGLDIATPSALFPFACCDEWCLLLLDPCATFDSPKPLNTVYTLMSFNGVEFVIHQFITEEERLRLGIDVRF